MKGCGDMFPYLSKEERLIASDENRFIQDGKKDKKENGPDTLLTLAGLASFTADQVALDNRIRSIIE
jgi:transaldolase